MEESIRVAERTAAAVLRVARLDGQAAVREGEVIGAFGNAVVLGVQRHGPAPLVVTAIVTESHGRLCVGRVHGEGTVPGKGQRRAPGPIQGSVCSGVSDLVLALQLDGEIPEVHTAGYERLDLLQLCAVQRQLAQLYPRDLLAGQQLLDRGIRDIQFIIIPVFTGDLAAVEPAPCVGYRAVAQHIRIVLVGDVDLVAVLVSDQDAKDELLPPGIEGHIPRHSLGEVIGFCTVGIRVPAGEGEVFPVGIRGPDSRLVRLDDLLGIDPAQLPVRIGHGDRLAVGVGDVGLVIDRSAGVHGLAAEPGGLTHAQTGVVRAAGDMALRGNRAVEAAAGEVAPKVFKIAPIFQTIV